MGNKLVKASQLQSVVTALNGKNATQDNIAAELREDVNGKVLLNGEEKSNVNFISTTTPPLVYDEYGLKVDLEAGTFTRLGGASGKTLNDFYNFAPWSKMRRVVIDGQYMVQIPLFYYKRVATKTEEIPQSADSNEIGKQLVIWEDWISFIPRDGYFVHPMFVRNGKIVENIYFSAFEGSIYDVSEGVNLLEDEQVADFNNDLLCSIPNAKPCSGKIQNLTIENTRKLANNRNTTSNYNWFQQDFTTSSGIQLLITISIGNFDCQGSIGQGVVDIADTPSTDNNSVKTGQTIDMGIRCGFNGVNGQSSVNFFGIENFWGNIWKFVDGINIEAKSLHQGWISNDKLEVNTSANKDNLGFTISKVNGYMSRIGYDENIDFGFVPTKTTGDGLLSKDYFYQNNTYNGFLIARLGGRWLNGSGAGCFSWGLNNAASYRDRSIGARLVCIEK